MVIYFSLIVIVTVFMACEFWIQFRIEKVSRQVLESVQVTYAKQEHIPQPTLAIIRYWRNKIILLLALLVVVSAMVFIMFVKNIIGPLNHMVKAAQKIASGDLRESIEVKSNDELAEVGELINDLTANIQEIITNTLVYLDDIESNMYRCKENLTKIIHEEGSHKAASEIESSFLEARGSLEGLKNLLGDFNLYEIKIKKPLDDFS